METKGKLITEHTKGVNTNDLANKYKLHRTTVARIIKEKETISKHYESVKKQSGNINAKKISKFIDSPFENALYMWLVQKRSLGDEPISGIILKEQAKLFYEHFHGQVKLSASDGWLEKFKKRHNIRTLSVKGNTNLTL